MGSSAENGELKQKKKKKAGVFKIIFACLSLAVLRAGPTRHSNRRPYKSYFTNYCKTERTYSQGNFVFRVKRDPGNEVPVKDVIIVEWASMWTHVNWKSLFTNLTKNEWHTRTLWIKSPTTKQSLKTHLHVHDWCFLTGLAKTRLTTKCRSQKKRDCQFSLSNKVYHCWTHLVLCIYDLLLFSQSSFQLMN